MAQPTYLCMRPMAGMIDAALGSRHAHTCNEMIEVFHRIINARFVIVRAEDATIEWIELLSFTQCQLVTYSHTH